MWHSNPSPLPLAGFLMLCFGLCRASAWNGPSKMVGKAARRSPWRRRARDSSAACRGVWATRSTPEETLHSTDGVRYGGKANKKRTLVDFHLPISREREREREKCFDEKHRTPPQQEQVLHKLFTARGHRLIDLNSRADYDCLLESNGRAANIPRLKAARLGGRA